MVQTYDTFSRIARRHGSNANVFSIATLAAVEKWRFENHIHYNTFALEPCRRALRENVSFVWIYILFVVE